MTRKGWAKGIKPIPEVLDDSKNPWTIRETMQASVDKENRIINVPFGTDNFSQQIRTHEMAHVRYSPTGVEVPDGVTLDILLACEDGRLNSLMKMAGITNSEAVFMGADVIDRMKMKVASSPEVAAALLICSLGTPDGPLVLNAVAERSPVLARYVENVHSMFFREPEVRFSPMLSADAQLPYENTVKAAKALMRIINPTGNDGPPATEWDEDNKEALEPLLQQLMYQEEETNEWGEMTIVRPPMPVSLPAGLKHTVHRSVDEGTFMTRPHRYMIDKAIFGVKTRKPGGATVLIDASGSMGLDSQQLYELVSLLPAATVALYFGEETTGQLVYIAQDGRRVEDPYDHVTDGMNVIDGPALRWLNEQAEPRIWVSDGYVTGIHDRAAVNLTLESAALMSIGKVHRLNDMDEVMAYLKAKGYASGR
jgi:hypothetical protein